MNNVGPLLAHSAPEPGRVPHPYADHVSAVRVGARARADAILRFATRPPPHFAESIEVAAAVHDLGKLDPATQAALRKGRGERLRWDHIDAGVAHLWACKAATAAWLVRAHHAPGLPSYGKHFADSGLRLRGCRNDDRPKQDHDNQIDRTQIYLDSMLASHISVAGRIASSRSKPCHGLAMRLALSCLVDADHSDTAAFDTGSLAQKPPESRWAERLAQLDAYIGGLSSAGNPERNRHRHEFYQACRHSTIAAPLVTCEGPVGIGKTTAVTAYLLQRAVREEPRLRRLIVVAPYTNIISQTTATLRRALTLPGENPEEVVAEHHHRADFGSREAREFAVTWIAPIVVTTAVQLFGTLASNEPAATRKLHTLPGSAIFLDEAHAALPAHLWQQNWSWLVTLARGWGCRVVFASGSLVRFWENPDVVDEPEKLPDLLTHDLRRSILGAEARRITYVSCSKRFETLKDLVRAVTDQDGPRLVILNTVQSAAVTAQAMRESGHDVMHISTALAPKDRGPLLQAISERLKTSLTDWTLVATSCVEAGVDLSFRAAFRERFSAASLVQTGGRVNRHGGDPEGRVFDFVIDAADGITTHPAAKNSARVLRRLLESGSFQHGHDPAALVSHAMALEIKERGGLASDRLREAECERDYPAVAKLGQVIDADTRLVVVDRRLAARIERREKVSFRDILAGSVQLWASKIAVLKLEPLRGTADVFRWPYDYDPDFLGFMQGFLRLHSLASQGCLII